MIRPQPHTKRTDIPFPYTLCFRSCLSIGKDMPGVSFGAPERKTGWHAQPTAALILDNVRVPAENMVGGLGQVFRIAMQGLDGGRLNIGACSLGEIGRAHV